MGLGPTLFVCGKRFCACSLIIRLVSTRPWLPSLASLCHSGSRQPQQCAASSWQL